MIVAFEGIDGAGKNTLVRAVEGKLIGRELPVATGTFPRYEESIHAQMAAAALRHEMGDLTGSIHGMATLFALDRAEVAEELAQLSEDGYVVLLDRYVASNAAYSAARAATGADTAAEQLRRRAGELPVVHWVAELEFDRLGIPVPDLTVLVSASPELAGQRARWRERVDESRRLDAYESNATLQELTAAAYAGLAAAEWCGPWMIAESGDGDVQRRAREIADAIERAAGMSHTHD
ncbi:dTMP kinase [Corynebacterium heidelbergense]|uniref:Thymidylate kinase n=1 Tax=Corynebacterium heidelbergense TaxID=2055947 RepID=A0A364VA70_9CORY|nr:dTMP kinase [Corynebacterium heidelbergense]RAV33508.1 thymidylate kinase [Corynebacterium heidelbergense]WCZ37187.1 Thymidylate kinase [Corynebacterium heidelbergense]